MLTRRANTLAILPGLWLLAVVVSLAVFAVNNPSPLSAMAFALATLSLVPTGFELCRFACSADPAHRFFAGGSRAYAADILVMLLAICLTAATVRYQHPSPAFCAGRLSAGFPAAFICDASGESPLSSVGKIDRADLDSISLLGSSVDVLFYMALLGTARLALGRLSRRPRS